MAKLIMAALSLSNAIAALCLIRTASALKIAARRGVEGVEVVRARMEGARGDIGAQAQGCMELAQVWQEGRELEAEGPYNRGKFVPTRFLEAGIGEAMSQGLLNIVASTGAPEDAIFRATLACFYNLQGLVVQNNAEKGLALYRHSPHLWEASIATFRRFWRRPELKTSACFFAGTYGTFRGADGPAAGLAEAGGVDLLLDMLDQSHGDAGMMQRIFCAFSDNVQASKQFADTMLSRNGAQRFVDAARATHLMEHFHEANGYGLKYEALEDIVGLIKHDGPDRNVTRAFAAAGLLDVVSELMPDEPGDLYLQDHACQVVNFLASGDVEVQRKLAGSPGIIKSVRDAVGMKCAPACAWPPAVVAWNPGFTNETSPPSCRFTLSSYEGGIPWKEAWSDAHPHP